MQKIALVLACALAACSYGSSGGEDVSNYVSGDAGDQGRPNSTNGDAGSDATSSARDAAPVQGDAGGDDAGDPYGTPSQCSSNKTWTGGDNGNAEMHPGVACDTCHKIGGSATKYPFDVAGTVYPTAHEPDDCYGAMGAAVVVTDAKGTDHQLAVNAAGNFYNLDYLGVGAIATPYTAKVVMGGKERAMIASQTNGDCNSCHTENGAMAAPGRIMLP